MRNREIAETLTVRRNLASGYDAHRAATIKCVSRQISKTAMKKAAEAAFSQQIPA
jgi:hypothetical protein